VDHLYGVEFLLRTKLIAPVESIWFSLFRSPPNPCAFAGRTAELLLSPFYFPFPPVPGAKVCEGCFAFFPPTCLMSFASLLFVFPLNEEADEFNGFWHVPSCFYLRFGCSSARSFFPDGPFFSRPLLLPTHLLTAEY